MNSGIISGFRSLNGGFDHAKEERIFFTIAYLSRISRHLALKQIKERQRLAAQTLVCQHAQVITLYSNTPGAREIRSGLHRAVVILTVYYQYRRFSR